MGEETLPGKVNYIIGSDATKWRTNVPTYRRVVYKDIASGIDLVFYGSQEQLEFDFVVRPGSDPRGIRLTFKGAQDMEIDADGTLRLETPSGPVRLRRPVARQSKGRAVRAGYVRLGPADAGIALGPYDRRTALTIDPVLVFSTYLGSNAGGVDAGPGLAVDAGGNVYVTGTVQTADFPVSPGAFQSTGRGVDAFVAKLNPAGTALVYATYLGGGGRDEGVDLKVDAAGNAFVTGRTDSPDFPVTASAYQRMFGGGTGDVFATKLNAAGTALLYSTYLGGSGLDRPYGLAIDPAGSAYIGGQTLSANYPVTTATLQGRLRGNMDGFVSKLDPTGGTLAYSTFLGGDGADVVYGVAVDSGGRCYVTGLTRSGTSFPVTAGAYQPPVGGSAIFIVKLNASGGAMEYSSRFGGGSPSGIAVDAAGTAYITGQGRVPTTPGAAFETAYDDEDAFVVKMNSNGTGLAYSSYLGGTSDERGTSIAVDAKGNVFVTGYTESRNFPVTSDAVQLCEHGQYDVFVTKVNPEGSAVLWSTYLGGAVSDWASAIAIDAAGNLYLAGYAGGNPFPDVQPDFPTTPGSFRPAGGGAFVTKIGWEEAPPGAAPMVTGIVNGATFGCQIQQNSWITIRGSNLAATTRVWTAQDIVDGLLPTSLDGVRVTVQGKPAALYYVSPSQINALAPGDPEALPQGRVAVSVENSLGAARGYAELWAAAPGWFTFAPRNGRYVAGTLADGTYLGPPGLFESAAVTKPARPGDVIVLYGTGFGETLPPVPSGRVILSPLPLASPVSVTIGGVAAEVLFAGVTAPGLYQFNIVVPEVPDGDQLVVGTALGHYPTQPAFVAIRR